MAVIENPDTLKSLHRALINLNKRAERSSNEILVSNFVDSEPLFDLLATHNNQVIYGRRGTGKTHALKYLAEHVANEGDRAVYIDLRSVGSNNSIYSDTSKPLASRALTLIVDVLEALYNELLGLAVSVIDQAPDPAQITLRVDDLAAAISAVQISGAIEEEREGKIGVSREARVSVDLAAEAKPSAKVGFSLSSKLDKDARFKTKRSGAEQIHLDFGNINVSLNGLLEVINTPRIWLLIDEWSEIPVDLQPYLADLIRRTILPINQITVKVAAIEHRSQLTYYATGANIQDLSLVQMYRQI